VGSCNDFFTGSATIAGALTGLLVVALSVQPERNRDRHAIEHRPQADSAVHPLVDLHRVHHRRLRGPADHRPDPVEAVR
jgi:hypothetical protein